MVLYGKGIFHKYVTCGEGVRVFSKKCQEEKVVEVNFPVDGGMEVSEI